MSKSFIIHSMIKPQSLERREYQVSLTQRALETNSVVVLPTGLGKTVVALLAIAEHLRKETNARCVLLAPTRVLVHQHYNFLREHLNIQPESIAVITGEDEMYYREERWEARVVCATPQIMKTDMARNLVRTDLISLIIFDEVHRTSGDYAYGAIADQVLMKNDNVRMIGMTASLPSDQTKVREILKVLRAGHIELRDHESPDVKPYVQETSVEYLQLDLPENMRRISNLVRKVLTEYAEQLRAAGFKLPYDPTLKSILDLREKVDKAGKYDLRVAVYSSIRLVHALGLLETQGVSTFVRFLERLSERSRAMGVKKMMSNQYMKEALEIARGSRLLGLEHPKIPKLREILSSLGANDKAIIFTSYRDSVDEIYRSLVEQGFRTGVLIGKRGESGQTQDEQLESLDRLRSGEYDILVATQVGEEGIDVSECKLVVFYDNVSSAVRYVQRRGRTGRRAPGRVVALIAKGTRDQIYLHLVKRRLAQARRTAEIFNSRSENQRDLDNFIRHQETLFG